MSDDEASAHAAAIYAALQAVEARHPDSIALRALHGALEMAWTAYAAAHPGVVSPFDGTSKPAPGP